MTLKIAPMNIGLFRLLNQLRHSLSLMTTQFGMTESDLDEIKVRKGLGKGREWRGGGRGNDKKREMITIMQRKPLLQ